MSDKMKNLCYRASLPGGHASVRLVSLLLLSLMAILLSGCNLTDVVGNLGDTIGDTFRNALDF